MLHSVFKDKSLLKLLPPIPENKVRPVVISYKNTEAFSRHLFNYSKEIKNITTHKLISIIKSPCDCLNSQFCYPHVRHVITGDSDVTNNDALKEVISKGTKYRLPTRCDWDKVHIACSDAIDIYINKLRGRLHLNPEVFRPFRNRALTILTNRITVLSKSNAGHNDNVNNMVAINEDCNRLKSRFVITPVDKASNNFCFTCKKYYFEVMCKELGILFGANDTVNFNGNDTYVPTTEDINSIYSRHKHFANVFTLQLSDDDMSIPTLFAIPKLHKNPYKFRFIAGAQKSSIKILSQLLHVILSHIRKHFQNYCKKSTSYDGINRYWSVSNSQAVTNMLHRAEYSGIMNFTVADFSTLYTNLPHSVIKNCITYLIYKCLGNAGHNYIAVPCNFTGPFYTNCWYTSNSTTNPRSHIILEKSAVIGLLNFVIDETYVKFGNWIFKQVCGIPMGSNSSPLLADLTLSVMEYKFLSDPINRPIAKQINFASRYLDDVIFVNVPTSATFCDHIYHDSLTLEFSEDNSYSCNYLDLAIIFSPTTHKLELDVYNKTDAFNFNVIRYGFPTSNVPFQLHYQVFSTELLRFARICSTMACFTTRVEELTKTLLEREFCANRLLLNFCKTYSRNNKTFFKIWNLHLSRCN